MNENESERMDFEKQLHDFCYSKHYKKSMRNNCVNEYGDAILNNYYNLNEPAQQLLESYAILEMLLSYKCRNPKTDDFGHVCPGIYKWFFYNSNVYYLIDGYYYPEGGKLNIFSKKYKYQYGVKLFKNLKTLEKELVEKHIPMITIDKLKNFFDALILRIKNDEKPVRYFFSTKETFYNLKTGGKRRVQNKTRKRH